ncbi:hypothetical protein [Roseateles sp.]|uniref:hypothetical protein n=1 Tax=Roseateles sp. TaxID=1971397 RepID=UPI0039E93291
MPTSKSPSTTPTPSRPSTELTAVGNVVSFPVSPAANEQAAKPKRKASKKRTLKEDLAHANEVLARGDALLKTLAEKHRATPKVSYLHTPQQTIPVYLSQVQRPMTKERTQAAGLLKKRGFTEEKFKDTATFEEAVSLAERVLFLRGKKNRYRVSGEPIFHDLHHTIHAPTQLAAERLQADICVYSPDLAHGLRIYQPAETLDMRIVLVRRYVRMTAEIVLSDSVDLLRRATEFGCQYEGWSPYDDAPPDHRAPAELSAAERRKLAFRAEYLNDVLLARAILAPYIWSWTETDMEAADSEPLGKPYPRGMDHEIHVQLVKWAPCLDDLRWLLSQSDDMHIAAESLDYSVFYTGARLSYTIIDQLNPTEAVKGEMRDAMRDTLRMSNGANERLADLGEKFGIGRFDDLDADNEAPYSENDD